MVSTVSPPDGIANHEEIRRIAIDYAFDPNPGIVYERAFHVGAELEVLMFAHLKDKTNILVRYNPLFCCDFPYVVTGTLDPDASGNYGCESGFNLRPTYVGPLRDFFLWWNGTDSWYISGCVGDTTGAHWKLVALCLVGDYNPVGGATGIATIASNL